MTEKLYWADPHATSFETDGAMLVQHGDRPSLVLPRTLFYPEGGGQLGDSGTLTLSSGETLRVVDTQIDDAGTIHHLLETNLGILPDRTAVRGKIDAARRADHMAQHTAQHALSRALVEEARADTVSARLGATSCTIDLSRAGVSDGELLRAEDLVNAVAASDVVVRSLFPTPEELAALPLRKQPKVSEGIRVIEIDKFDVTPCGGTHCTRTGQLGQIRIVSTEKHKGMLRVTFHAGVRALADARAKHNALLAAATDLTCGVLDVPAGVQKLRAELKALRAQLETARSELAETAAASARARLPDPTTSPGPIVLPIERPNDELSTLRVLAGKLAEDPRVVALVATTDPSTGELVVVAQRGASSGFDCGAFIKSACQRLAGKGGGRTDRAEGRFPRGVALDLLAKAAVENLPITPDKPIT